MERFDLFVSIEQAIKHSIEKPQNMYKADFTAGTTMFLFFFPPMYS